MNHRFAKQKGPLFAAVIKESNVRRAMAAVRNACVHGANAVDLHISPLEKTEITAEKLRPLFQGAQVPMMALSYNWDAQGNYIEIPDETRMEWLLTACEAGADCVDMQAHTFGQKEPDPACEAWAGKEGYSFTAKKPREINLAPEVLEKQREWVRKFHEAGADVLMSAHVGVNLNCQEMLDLAAHLAAQGADILKFVGICDTDEEFAEYCRSVFALKKAFPQLDIHYHCNGAKGPLTRAIAPMLGSYLVFCNDGYQESSDINQLDLESMTTIWRLLRAQGIV